MSNWVVNASAAIPFSGSVGSTPYPYVYYGDQAANSQHGQAVASPEGFPGRGMSGAPGSAPPQPMVAAPWSYQLPAANMRAWPNQQALPAGVISGQAQDQASVQITPKHDPQMERIADLERDLQGTRSQLEQQQQEGRILLAQVESLTSELAAERQRSDELGRQVLTMSAVHQALQLEYERLTSQHSAVVREHEHMTSSQAVTLRELEARHADVSRLQRQLEEAQATVAAATAAADAAAGGGQQAGTATQRGGQRASAPPPPPLVRLGGRVGSHLAAADEERWALRLHKAERALEEERRVSEDLRQRLKAADVESRAMFKRLHKLESELESPPGGAMPIANSELQPRSPRALSPLSMPPPMATTSSGTLASLGSGQLPGMGSGQLPGMGSGPASFAAGPALGRAASAGSGGGGTSVMLGVVKAGMPPGSGSSSIPQLPHPTEEQVVRLKREVDGLRSDLTRLAAAEEVHRVAARAADDRARAAELVSLDVRRQCDQAARTIGRLIDENSELVAKVNAQANALSECKSAAASKETAVRNLEARLEKMQAQLLAAQAQARDLSPRPPGEHPQHPQQQPEHHGVAGGPAGTTAPHGSVPSLRPQPQIPGSWRPGGAAPGREVLPPGAPLTEADWKLVMLSEEVRRLVEEVSLSTTACLALQLKLGQGGLQQQLQQQEQVSPLDLPHILSRLEGLAGRRLAPGETAAYIIELAGHMEALEQVLTAQRRRMAALRGAQAGAETSGAGVGTAGGAGDAGAGDDGSSGPSAAGALQESERLRQDKQQQQRTTDSQAERALGSRMQDTESRGEERWVHAEGEGAVGAGPLLVQDVAAAEGEFADGADSSGVPVRQTAFGSSFSSVTSHVESADQQQLPPPSASPQSPGPAPPPSSYHIVSPFNHLAQRKDSQQQQQEGQQGDQPGVGSSGGVAAANPSAADGESQGSSLEFRSVQRPELAAAAAAAVAAAAAAAAAEAEADRSAGTDAAATALPGPGGMEDILPMVLPQLEAPPSPRAASGTVAVSAMAVGLPAQLVGVAVNGVDPLFDDDLLDEVAAGRVKPRRPRVGLWGWISGEAAR